MKYIISNNKHPIKSILMAMLLLVSSFVASAEIFIESTYAAEGYKLVVRDTNNNTIIRSIAYTLDSDANIVAKITTGNDYTITITDNYTEAVLGTIDNIAASQVTSDGDSNFSTARMNNSFNYTIELWNENNETIAAGSPIWANREMKSWIIIADNGDGTYDVSTSSNTQGHIEMTEQTTTQEQIAATGQQNQQAVQNTQSQQTQQPTGSNDVTCSNVAGGIGWIACVVIDFFANCIKWIYERVIEPSLQVNPELLSTSTGTYTAWSSFRNIANILFVIYLLVVIFSQITGIGIDNYGIKKSLPKLVMAALLVNLSYFICQLAVDVSNIVGSSLYNFLSGINITVPDSMVAANGVTFISGLGSGFITLVIAGAVVAGTIWAYGGALAAGIAMLLPIGGAIAAATIALIFMFFLLGMRQAIVVLLVALSPLAFACYVLPNTKSIFDKWLKLGKGMLLLYPICALVIGGGYLASRIILASGGANDSLFILLTALVAEVGPFFLVPSLVKGAYAATGMLGAKLNGISSKLGGNARKLATSNRWAQNAEKNQKLATERAWAKRDIKSLDKIRSGTTARQRIRSRITGKAPNTELSEGQKRRLTAAFGTINSQRREDAALRGAELTYENFNPAAIEEGLIKEADKKVLEDEMVLVKKNTRGGQDANLLNAQFDSAYAKYLDTGSSEAEKAKAMVTMRAVTELAGSQKFLAKDFIGHVQTLDDNSDGKKQVISTIAKQIASGTGAKNYRASNAAGFEWATQMNGVGTSSLKFETWGGDSKNIDAAIDHNVTNASEMYSQSNGALEYLMKNASADGQAAMRRIASTARQEAKMAGSYDQTKDRTVFNIANGTNFANDSDLEAHENALAAAEQAADQAYAKKAEENETLKIQHGRLNFQAAHMNAQNGIGIDKATGQYAPPSGWADTGSGIYQNPNDPSERYDAKNNKFL